MMRVWIPYGTTEGQTARISEYVADVIRGHGYDAVIVGASIHMGKHEDYVLGFVRENPWSCWHLESRADTQR